MGFTAPPYPGYYGAPSAGYQAGFQMGRTNVQNPPSQTTPPQQGYAGQGYVSGTQSYAGQQGQQGQGYFGGQQSQYGSQGYSGSGSSGQQQYNNPNYQYYIGSNPPPKWSQNLTYDIIDLIASLLSYPWTSSSINW